MQDINLYHLLKFYAKNSMMIAVATILGALLGLTYNIYLQTPLYKSDATLLIVSTANSGATQNVTLINNYVELFKSRRVLEPVMTKLQVGTSYEAIVGSIEATNDKNTEVIKVAFSSNDSTKSKLFIEGAVQSFKKQVATLYNIDNVQIVDNASVAAEPYNVHKEIQFAIAAATGFLASIVVLFFIYDYQLSNPKTKSSTKAKKATAPHLSAKLRGKFSFAKKTKGQAKKQSKKRLTFRDRLHEIFADD